MTEKGLGDWQLQKMEAAVLSVLRYLGDNKWHRYQELLEKTKLSSATLSKHLKTLEKGVVEKKIDAESGLYPYPVSYRLREKYQIFGDLLNLPPCPEQKKMNHYIVLASKALSSTMGKIYTMYESDRNYEAFSQSRTIALRLYFEYTKKLEPE
jgi:DNA-binding transcriptional ArsR family regulator